jgi:hypothetical protein
MGHRLSQIADSGRKRRVDRIFAGFRRDGWVSDAADPVWTGGVFVMKAVFPMRALPALAGLTAALALAGCSATTYGTGTSAGLQTITDFAQAAQLGTDKPDINFSPRPPVVAPPSTSTLPVPGSGASGQTLAADWPKDPDQQAADVKAQIAAAQANGRPITVKQGANAKLDVTPAVDVNSPDNFKTTAEQDAEVKKLIAQENSVPVDANGKPVRQYLSDPPSGYLAPDPSAPPPTVTASAAGKKPLLKWPWQWFQKN